MTTEELDTWYESTNDREAVDKVLTRRGEVWSVLDNAGKQLIYNGWSYWTAKKQQFGVQA